MKARLATILILFTTASLNAQDDLGTFGGLFGGDVGIAPPAAARGAAPSSAARGAVPAVDRLLRLKDALTKVSAPLAKDQEAALNALLDAEVPAMRKSLQAKVAELGLRPTAPPPPSPPPATAQAGQRGPAAAPLPNIDAKTEVTLRRFILGLNDELFQKVIAVPSLRPEQRALLTTIYKDQIRSRGGLDAIQLALDDAGAGFTPEQLSQIQPIFDEQDQARAALQQASAGPVDPAKAAQIEQSMLIRVLRLLTPEQRAALQRVSTRPQP